MHIISPVSVAYNYSTRGANVHVVNSLCDWCRYVDNNYTSLLCETMLLAFT